MDAPRALVAKPPTGRKMKPRAPPPPGKPATVNMHSEQNPPQDASPGPQQNLLKMKENLQNSVVAITVVLPSGLEKRSVVNGSRAMMDLLVELCLQNHLNPSHHALEIRSLETQQPLSFKPNTLVGTLNVHTVFLKEKVREEKVKPGPPKAPEKSVRLVVNYLRTQKAVVRVSPEVPLRNILPVICAKCEVSPEHVVLLRDSAAGEELELSKSLNELGIKELYAWDNKRETFRKSSLGNEETDKEKKKFLGFFRANKRSNSKAEQIGLSGVDSDEDTSKSALGRGSNGCVTTPNSPAVNPRSAPLGPSLSLSNISGVSVKSDMKKRRAPPPPPLPGTGTGPPAQDKPSEKVSLGSQIDLQKKKRRAPAPPPLQPPPPSPVVPARIDDKEEHRKSGAGVGRQVPQKPPRGSARGPPQLVLPPPPPYPPPDMDVAEPLSFPGQNAGPEASDLTPTLSLLLGPGSRCSEDGVPPALTEAEETVSVGSCFASEDTTEDSGVMSSPSDIISLDSQHDSMKSKDKWATDQEDCSDQDLAGTPELGPQKSPSWERSSSGTWHPRSEKAAISSNGEDLFITGQFQKTLAELNEDLEEMEESYETDTSSPTSSVNGMSSGCTRDTVVPHSDVETIPVTFIGEVLDDPVDLALFSNRNNNAGSFDMGNIASRRVDLPPDHAEHSQEHSKKRTGLPTSAAVSHGVGKQLKFSVSQTCKDVNLNQGEPKMTSAPKLHTHDLSAKEKGREPTSTLRGKTQAVRTSTPPPVEEKEGGGGKNGVSAPPSWYQRAQNLGGSYGLKYGLTTYKIVPPKSEMRCYDRGVSLSVGAIKIDELGNLVCPRTHAGRTTALPSSTLEAEMQPIGKVKDFWRSNSMGKQCGRPMECSAKRSPTPAAPVELQHPESRPKAEPAFPDPRVAPPQQLATHHGDGSHAQEGRSRPPTATPGQRRGPAATTEVPFLKPQRRTSSQYVASAIAKRIGTPRAHPDVVRKQDDVQEPHEGRGPEPAGRPPTAKDAATPSRCSESHDREDSGESAVGAHPRQQVSSPHGELCTQHCSAGIHRGSSVPLVPASQRDHVSVGRSCDSSGQQSTSSHRTRSASDPKSTLDSTNPLRPHSDDQTHVRALVNGSRWVPTHGEPPPSSRAAGTCSHAGWEPSELEKPSLSCTEVHTSNGVLPPSIFGPKKKFRPVVQRPAPRDTCLHSALMEAIHSAGGRDRLRKTTEHTAEGGPKKPSYVEAESERSALLAAIRRHSGACSLRKVSSSASKELQSARDTALSAPRSKPAGPGDLPPAQPSASLPAPPPPAPRAPSAARTASRASSGPVSNPAEARQALMDAIRSGTGAARLRKVCVSIPGRERYQQGPGQPDSSGLAAL